MESLNFPLNKRFKPSTAMMTWYRVGIALILGVILLFCFVPLVVFGEMPALFSFVTLALYGSRVYLPVDLGRHVLRQYVI